MVVTSDTRSRRATCYYRIGHGIRPDLSKIRRWCREYQSRKRYRHFRHKSIIFVISTLWTDLVVAGVVALEAYSLYMKW